MTLADSARIAAPWMLLIMLLFVPALVAELRKPGALYSVAIVGVDFLRSRLPAFVNIDVLGTGKMYDSPASLFYQMLSCLKCSIIIVNYNLANIKLIGHSIKQYQWNSLF